MRSHRVLSTSVMVLLAGPLLAACASDESFCEQAAELQTTDLTGSGVEAGVNDALEILDGLVDSAPDEIVGDLVVVRDGVGDFIRTRRAPDADFAAASQRVTSFLTEECAVTPGTSG